MTSVDLEYPRAEAIELVKAAFENTPSVLSYEANDRDGIIVGRSRTGVTSLGEEIVVSIPEARDEEKTTITVQARRKVSYNSTANPWKPKSEFLDALRDLRGTPVSEIPRIEPDEERSDETGPDEGANDDASDLEREATSEAMIETAKLLLLVAVGLLAIMLALAAVAALTG